MFSRMHSGRGGEAGAGPSGPARLVVTLSLPGPLGGADRAAGLGAGSLQVAQFTSHLVDAFPQILWDL